MRRTESLLATLRNQSISSAAREETLFFSMRLEIYFFNERFHGFSCVLSSCPPGRSEACLSEYLDGMSGFLRVLRMNLPEPKPRET